MASIPTDCQGCGKRMTLGESYLCYFCQQRAAKRIEQMFAKQQAKTQAQPVESQRDKAQGSAKE